MIKSVIYGVLAFVLCQLIYSIVSIAIENEITYSYKQGHSDGFFRKNQIQADSLDNVINARRKTIDSLYNSIKP